MHLYKLFSLVLPIPAYICHHAIIQLKKTLAFYFYTCTCMPFIKEADTSTSVDIYYSIKKAHACTCYAAGEACTIPAFLTHLTSYFPNGNSCTNLVFEIFIRMK